MKRYIGLLLIAGLMLGCGQRKHPVKVVIDPEMKSSMIEQVAVFPFASSLSDADDPSHEAPKMMGRLFRQQLDTRDDYKFLSPTSVEYALHGAGLEDMSKQFVDEWRTKNQVDRQFLTRFADATQADAVLVGVVNMWQKDEIDYRETSTPATYVGASVTLFRVSDGKVLFSATDEDFLEGAHSEAADRGAIRSGSGAVQSDRAAALYKAPEYESVAVKVAHALAMSIPAR